MSHYHAVVWIDHQKATAWHFTSTEQTGSVAHALDGAHEILVIGPAQTKQEFANYLRDKHPQLGRAVVAVENSDHPTDPEVLAYARRHFTAIDRMFTPVA